MNDHLLPTTIAKNLDEVWLNFEPDIPLPANHPFYVELPETPINELIVKLTLGSSRNYTPKIFFSGHKGCGKSTQLLRLIADPRITNRFFPVLFSIRNHVDLSDLDFKDILFAMGNEMFTQYNEKIGKMPDNLLKGLEEWQGEIETEVTRLNKGRWSGDIGAEAGAEVKDPTSSLFSFFGKVSGALRLEPKIREQLRQTIQSSVTKLIEKLDLIAVTIQKESGKLPLLVIDDLDKVDVSPAREIFHNRYQAMCQPNFPIIYTVSSALFYTPECTMLRENAYFLPNIKLHFKKKKSGTKESKKDAEESKKSPEGYASLTQLIKKRIDPDLIEPNARTFLIKMSGGVVRELARLVQAATINALSLKSETVAIKHAEHAVNELRRTYWRILDAKDRALLQQVHDTNDLDNPSQLAQLFQMLALLEYSNGDIWGDVHPVILHLLDTLK